MEIQFTEYQDAANRRTVVIATVQVGEREIRSQAYISEEACRPSQREIYFNSVYQRLKDEVRRRALNEMRVQQVAEPRFANITVPLVRRVYPQLITENLVGVQPLQGRAELVHYLRHRYASSRDRYEKVDWKKEGF